MVTYKNIFQDKGIFFFTDYLELSGLYSCIQDAHVLKLSWYRVKNDA